MAEKTSFMRAIIIVVGCLILSSCGTVNLQCPTDHVVTATLDGPNVASIAMQLAAAIGPMMMANKAPGLRAEPTAPAANDGTLVVKTLDIFGTQSYSCGNLSAIAPPKPMAEPAPTPAPKLGVPDDPSLNQGNSGWVPQILPPTKIHSL